MKNKDFTPLNNHLEETEGSQPKKDRSKIYFFLLAIIALLTTNTYFYLKYKTTADHSYELGNEKTLMQEEINQIEIELNRLSTDNLNISQALQDTQDSVRLLIEQLKTELQSNNLSREKLAKAQQEIHQLRQRVNNYKSDLADLREENLLLKNEKENLKETIKIKNEQLAQLADSNSLLNEQISSAAILKVSKINLIGLRNRTGKPAESESKAKRVDLLRINFTIVDNPLVELGKTNIYLRIIDPSGNLNTQTNQFFAVDGTPMQYTSKTEIEFTNLGEEYIIDWVDSNKFKKGIYTILLYTDQSTMGRASIVLN